MFEIDWEPNQKKKKDALEYTEPSRLILVNGYGYPFYIYRIILFIEHQSVAFVTNLQLLLHWSLLF